MDDQFGTLYDIITKGYIIGAPLRDLLDLLVGPSHCLRKESLDNSGSGSLTRNLLSRKCART